MERNTGAHRRAFHHLQAPWNVRAASLGLGVFAAIALCGCAGSSEAAPSEAARSGPGLAVDPATPSAQGAGAPSDAARMICSAQTRASVASALALPEAPEPTDDWANQTYGCTYDLEQGPLILTVREHPDAASALHAFDYLRGDLGQGEPIEGLASLGLPAYKTPGGTVIFAKDNMILEVDATAMDPELGPSKVSRSDFAYQIATNVLACWTAHHS